MDFETSAGIEIVHVPFNGSPPAVTATTQGDTQMLFAVMQPLQPQIHAGRLRAIAVTSSKRFPLLPDIPTIAEAGYPGFEALAWNGILVAARTPRPIVQRLNTEINAILGDSTVKGALNLQGFDLVGGTPEDFAKLIRSESEKWAPVIRKTGARIDELATLTSVRNIALHVCGGAFVDAAGAKRSTRRRDPLRRAFPAGDRSTMSRARSARI